MSKPNDIKRIFSVDKQWYHGLEFIDTWRWVVKTDKLFVHHTAESLEADLEQWLVDIQGN
jgi:hypothetical protein